MTHKFKPRANLNGVDLRGADLRNARLFYSTFLNADLRDVDFSGADLLGADFRGANLSGANFKGANFLGCLFTGANVKNTVIALKEATQSKNLQKTYRFYKTYNHQEYNPFTGVPKPEPVYTASELDVEVAVAKMEKATGLSFMGDKMRLTVEAQ